MHRLDLPFHPFESNLERILTCDYYYDFIEAVIKVNVAKLKTELSKYLQLVQGGKEIVVTSHGQEVAKMIPVQTVTTAPVNWKDFFKEYPPIKVQWKGESAAELIRKVRDEE